MKQIPLRWTACSVSVPTDACQVMDDYTWLYLPLVVLIAIAPLERP